MAVEKEKIFEIFADSFPSDTVALKVAHPELDMNATVFTSGLHIDDLEKIKTKLAEKNIRLGKFIGAGTTALVFDVETTTGKKVPSAVIRLEQSASYENSDHSFITQPLGGVKEKRYTALIFAKGELPKETPAQEEYKRLLAALNTDGTLEKAGDLQPSAAMRMRKNNGDFVSYRDGHPALIITDTNAVGLVAQRELGEDIKSIARQFGLSDNVDEIKTTKLDEAELTHVKKQMDQVNKDVAEDLKRAGVALEGGWQGRMSGRKDFGVA